MIAKNYQQSLPCLYPSLSNLESSSYGDEVIYNFWVIFISFQEAGEFYG